MQGDNKNKKKKIRFKGLLIIILFFYLLVSFFYYIYTRPIKNINIEGNFYLKDNYLIDYLDLDDTSIFKLNKKSVTNKLLELDLISKASVKKNYFGTLNISVTEDKILFYNWNNKKIVLSSGKLIDYNKNYLGVPTLINYVPDSIYEELITKLNNINKEVLALVSEIEYSVSTINGKVVDDKRFLLRMNDGNKVYVNTINLEKLNNYLEIYEVIVNKNGDVKGCLYLDSNSSNNHFNNCEEVSIVGENDNNES